MTDQLYQPALYDMHKIEAISEMVGKMVKQNHSRKMILSTVINHIGSEYKKEIEKNIEEWLDDRRIFY